MITEPFTIYEVWAQPRDPYTGNELAKKECKKVYASEASAKKYKEEWEAKWQYHYDNNIAMGPCWIDYSPTLEIKEVTVLP